MSKKKIEKDCWETNRIKKRQALLGKFWRDCDLLIVGK